MKYEPFILKVYDLNNKCHIVDCLGYEHTIAYVKFILSSSMKIYLEDIDLYSGDNRLIDELKLEDYDINENTKIRMYFIIKSGFR